MTATETPAPGVPAGFVTFLFCLALLGAGILGSCNATLSMQRDAAVAREATATAHDRDTFGMWVDLAKENGALKDTLAKDIHTIQYWQAKAGEKADAPVSISGGYGILWVTNSGSIIAQ